MLRFSACADREPALASVDYIETKKEVSRDAFRAATIIPQYITIVQPNLLWDNCL